MTPNSPMPKPDEVAPPAGMQGEPGLLFRLVRDQRIAFLLVGGANTAIGFGFFIFFDLTVGLFFDDAVNRVVGSLATLGCAHVLSVLCAFVLYRRFVFKVRGHVWRDLARFEAVYLVAIGINAVVLPILVELGVNRIGAQGLILIVTTLISYFGHRHFSFRRSSLQSVETKEGH
jgi:putative flippase GtrA